MTPKQHWDWERQRWRWRRLEGEGGERVCFPWMRFVGSEAAFFVRRRLAQLGRHGSASGSGTRLNEHATCSRSWAEETPWSLDIKAVPGPLNRSSLSNPKYLP